MSLYYLLFLYISVEAVVEVELFVPDYTDEQLELLVSQLTLQYNITFEHWRMV